jgi:hypothetical protein
MIIVLSKNKVPVRLSSEKWEHIERRHPEMRNQKERILETISNPDFIQQGDYGEFLVIKFFDSTPLTQKYLVAGYKEIDKEDGFVITAYFTRKPLERRLTLWKQ